MIKDTQVTYEIKPMLYKIARVKNSSMWICEDREWDETNIQEFKAYKSLPFPLAMTIEEFASKHKIITHGTFVKLVNMRDNPTKDNENNNAEE